MLFCSSLLRGLGELYCSRSSVDDFSLLLGCDFTSLGNWYPHFRGYCFASKRVT